MDDIAEHDTFFHASFRATLPNFKLPTIFENDSTGYYSLINPDDHDHFLVDPAYRLSKASEAERTYKALKKIAEEVKRSYEE